MTWRDLNTAQWREDLCYLVEQLHRLHRNLFHTISRDAFDRTISSYLCREHGGYERCQIVKR